MKKVVQKQKKQKMRRVTVRLPKKLLEDCMELSGLGVTATIRLALEALRRMRAQHQLLALQGKIKFDRTYEQIKADRG